MRVALAPLTRAQECFLTGTGAELIPVRQIDAHRFAGAASPLLPTIVQGFKNRIARDCLKD